MRLNQTGRDGRHYLEVKLDARASVLQETDEVDELVRVSYFGHSMGRVDAGCHGTYSLLVRPARVGLALAGFLLRVGHVDGVEVELTVMCLGVWVRVRSRVWVQLSLINRAEGVRLRLKELQ